MRKSIFLTEYNSFPFSKTTLERKMTENNNF